MKLSGCMRNYIVYDIPFIFLMRQLFDKKVKYTIKHISINDGENIINLSMTCVWKFILVWKRFVASFVNILQVQFVYRSIIYYIYKTLAFFRGLESQTQEI